MTEPLTLLESEVRELVRRRGIDPVRDIDSARALVTEAVAEYDHRSLVGGVPILADTAGAVKTLVDAISGLGPLQQFLDDDEVEEIWINSPTQVFIARKGEPELTNVILSREGVRDLVEHMLKTTGRRLDLSSPFVDAQLPGGHRLHVVIPDVTRAEIAVNIRKFVVRANSLAQLVSLGSLPACVAAFLDAAVRAGLNVLVSGATQAGKTTMLNALAGSIPARERIVTCEEVFELRINHRDTVGLQTRQPSLEGTGEITLRRLVKEALRMRPNRLIIGEVREAESLDMLIALNAGVPGMCSLHANSGREAVTKICTLPLLAGENVSDRFITATVASAIDLVVQVEIDRHGRRRTREVLALSGRVEQGTVETSELYRTIQGRWERGSGFPPHPERFDRINVDLAELLRAEVVA